MRASEPASIDAGRWNHNIHYHPVILEALGSGCDRVLDVGCGEGILARALGLSQAKCLRLLGRWRAANDLLYGLGLSATRPTARS